MTDADEIDGPAAAAGRANSVTKLGAAMLGDAAAWITGRANLGAAVLGDAAAWITKAPVRAVGNFTAPPLAPSKQYHFFICHHQGSGGDQARVLSEMLKGRGYAVWYDNGVPSDLRNLEGMRGGVRSSASLLLFLSGRKELGGVPDASGEYEGPFTRWYCHQEIATARSQRLPVIGVMEVDEGKNKADLAEEKCRARTGAADGGPISEHKEDVLALLDGPRSVVFLPFRRQQHELESMLTEICL